MNDLFIQGLTIDWNRVRPYNYVRQIPAISGIDTFTFHKPITFFVGENGSGKSTLMNIMTGNVRPDSGSISFHEENRISFSRDQLIVYVPQYPAMYPNFILYVMLDYVAILKRAENREKQIRELLTVFELKEYEYKKIRGLSGGTKQRLAIAQSFIG